MNFQTEVLSLLKKVMPPEAEIDALGPPHKNDIEVAWRLGDDDGRPHKMSKTILIHVASDGVRDYEKASEPDRRSAMHRVKVFLERSLAGFDPANESRRDQVPPVEEWTIDSSVLFPPM